jgi:hypothetical protein
MRKINYPILIVVSLALAFLFLAYPLYVIRPFRPQGAGELAVALTMLQIRPIATTLITLATLLFFMLYCRAERRFPRRAAAAIAVLAVCGCTALARINIYEKMFHPMGSPSFEPVQATRLDGKEMVIAVNVGGAARAYPVRIISYHHIANDTVGGVPIVATY